MELLFLILVIFGFWIHSLKQKIDVLSAEVAQLKTGQRGTPSIAEAYIPQTDTVSQEEELRVREYTEDQRTALRQRGGESSREENDIIEWIKKDFMVKLGAFLLLLALGWFVSYAFANNWIGPVGRIVLGLMVGVAFMGLGTWRIPQYAHQGGIFAIVGSTTVLLTLFAARALYDFFTPESVLAIMFMAVVFIAYLSVKYDRSSLALSGLVLAAIAPLLTASPTDNVVMLFSYLLVVVLGTLWVVNLKRWSVLTLGALLVVAFHGVPFLALNLGGHERDVALLFSFMFTAIFFVANILGILFNEREETKGAHIMIGLGTGLYLVVWILGAAAPEWQSLLCAAWMFVFLLGSYAVYGRTGKSHVFYIYSATSLLLLGVGTAVELEGAALTIAFAIEAVLAVILTVHVLRDHEIAERVSLLFIIPILLSLESVFASSWYNSVFHEDLFVLLMVMITLGIAGRVLFESHAQSGNKVSAGVPHMVVSAIYGLVLVWLILHALMDTDSATMFSFIVYTLIGIPLFVTGRHMGNKALTTAGGVLIGFVVAHLLLIEVWSMELTGRIITFLVVGLLLMSTAFIRRQNQDDTTAVRDNQ